MVGEGTTSCGRFEDVSSVSFFSDTLEGIRNWIIFILPSLVNCFFGSIHAEPLKGCEGSSGIIKKSPGTSLRKLVTLLLNSWAMRTGSLSVKVSSSTLVRTRWKLGMLIRKFSPAF